MVFKVECSTIGHEIYFVDAATEEEAPDMVESDGLEPRISEVTSLTIERVTHERGD